MTRAERGDGPVPGTMGRFRDQPVVEIWKQRGSGIDRGFQFS